MTGAGRSRRFTALALALLLAVARGAAAVDQLAYTEDERRAIAALGPWPPRAVADTSNRWHDDPAAAALGARLFGDRSLSASGRVACADCHDPRRAFQDGRPVGVGQGVGTRNTPGLLDVAQQRWFGWDGATDSPWAASLRALENPAEMGGDPAALTARLKREPGLLAMAAAVGAVDDEAWRVLAAKAIGAYLGTLDSPRTPFDDFRDALVRGDRRAAARYPPAAQRGLRLFVGRGRCNLCHAGPRFSNGEFADLGLPFFLPGGGVDPGRHGGIRALRTSRTNRLGPYADDGGASGVATRHLRIEHRHFGEFRVPGLRALRATAPYFHDGRAATLADVVQHYSTLDEERLHADGQRLLVPLRLSPGEADDLVAFLETLSP